MGYLLICWPFLDRYNNYLNLYNELVCAVIFLILFLITACETSEPAAEALGWLMISLVLVSLAATWALFLPNMIKELLQIFRGHPNGKESTESAKDQPRESKSELGSAKDQQLHESKSEPEIVKKDSKVWPKTVRILENPREKDNV